MKKSVFFFLILFSLQARGQKESGSFVKKGILRSQLTVSPGFMPKHQIGTISLHKNLEYYVSKSISIRQDGYCFLSELDPSGMVNHFKFNHSVFIGASYHLRTKNRFDPYFVLQPGIAFSKKGVIGSGSFDSDVVCRTMPGFNTTYMTDPNAYIMPKRVEEVTKISPLMSASIGFNYYFPHYFHLFVDAKYIYGTYHPETYRSLSLSEFKISLGVGWNFNLKKNDNMQPHS